MVAALQNRSDDEHSFGSHKSENVKEERLAFLNQLMTGKTGRTQFLEKDKSAEQKKEPITAFEQIGLPENAEKNSEEEREINLEENQDKNKEFLKTLMMEAKKLRELEAAEGKEEKELSESLEEKDVGNQNELDGESEKSHHSLHFSERSEEVIDEERQYTINWLIPKLKAVTAMVQAQKLSSKLKKQWSDVHGFLVSRHFKNIPYLNTLIEHEGHNRYWVSFKAVLYNPQGHFDVSRLGTELAIILTHPTNFHLDAKTSINLRDYMIEKNSEAEKMTCSPGNLKVICAKILQSIIVVDREICFKDNLFNLVNDPLQIFTFDAKNKEEMGHDDNWVHKMNQNERYVKDGCVYDLAAYEPKLEKDMRMNDPAKYMRIVVKMQKSNWQLTEKSEGG
jgi:hypothetical protein